MAIGTKVVFFITALITVLFLIIGSFLNVLIYRIPRSESIAWPRSHCINCSHSLGVIDLIPVFSYLFLRGRCRYCGDRISVRYPLVEIITALTCVLVYIKGGLSIWTLAGWIFACILIVSAFIDIEEGIIPDVITYPGMVAGVLFSSFSVGLKSSLWGGLFFGLVFLLIVILTRGGMGLGDVKLAAVIGVFTGLEGAWLVFILASLMGGCWAACLVLLRKADRKTAVKFGPFLALAGYVIWNWQAEAMNLYWHWLNNI